MAGFDEATLIAPFPRAMLPVKFEDVPEDGWRASYEMSPDEVAQSQVTAIRVPIRTVSEAIASAISRAVGNIGSHT
jgi:hypothetical protein